MLAVGRTLMGKPDLLMLDEPSLGTGAADREGEFSYHQCTASDRVLPRC